MIVLRKAGVAGNHDSQARGGAPPPRADTWLGRLAVAIRAVLLDQLVVHTHDQESGSPLANEQSPIVLAHDLEYGRPNHRPERGSKVTGRGYFGSLGFDSGGELALALSGYVDTAGKCHLNRNSFDKFSCGFACDDGVGKPDVIAELQFPTPSCDGRKIKNPIARAGQILFKCRVRVFGCKKGRWGLVTKVRRRQLFSVNFQAPSGEMSEV